jgi:Fe-S-cluster containining protein
VSPRRRSDDARETAALEAELEELYRDTDALFAGWSCPASTDCCHFERTRREPYVTSIELLAMRRAVARGVAIQRGSKALPMADGRCRMLTRDGKCSIYAARPFGCRTFFCDRADEGSRVKQNAINDLVRRLKGIAERHERGGDLGRPLSRCFDEIL